MVDSSCFAVDVDALSPPAVPRGAIAGEMSEPAALELPTATCKFPSSFPHVRLSSRLHALASRDQALLFFYVSIQSDKPVADFFAFVHPLCLSDPYCSDHRLSCTARQLPSRHSHNLAPPATTSFFLIPKSFPMPPKTSQTNTQMAPKQNISSALVATARRPPGPGLNKSVLNFKAHVQVVFFDFGDCCIQMLISAGMQI